MVRVNFRGSFVDAMGSIRARDCVPATRSMRLLGKFKHNDETTSVSLHCCRVMSRLSSSTPMNSACSKSSVQVTGGKETELDYALRALHARAGS